MNIGYYGTRELNQALYNRFNNIIEIGELSDKSIRRMLISRVPQCEPMVEKIISVFNKIKRKIENEELDMVISPCGFPSLRPSRATIALPPAPA